MAGINPNRLYRLHGGRDSVVKLSHLNISLHFKRYSSPGSCQNLSPVFSHILWRVLSFPSDVKQKNRCSLAPPRVPQVNTRQFSFTIILNRKGCLGFNFSYGYGLLLIASNILDYVPSWHNICSEANTSNLSSSLVIVFYQKASL